MQGFTGPSHFDRFILRAVPQLDVPRCKTDARSRKNSPPVPSLVTQRVTSSESFSTDRRLAAVKRSHRTADQEPGNGIPDVTATSRLRIFQKKNARLMVFSRAAGRAFYQYDFDDSWLHRIVVNRRRRGPADPPARFLNSARRGPLEDTGGEAGSEEPWTCRQTRP
jgi:hypothetical protein